MNALSSTLIVSVLVIAVLVLAVVPFAGAQDEPKPETVGLRPDAPPYALHGPYWVGARDFVIDPTSERPLVSTMWYPALNPENAEESVTYSFEVKFTPKPEIKTEVYGHALLGAAPDSSGAPYPLGSGPDTTSSIPVDART